MENIHYTISKEPTVNDLTLTPKGEHKNTVIFLHGLGDSAYGWLPIFSEPKLNPFPQNTKIILPTAPMIKITLNQGIPMNAWGNVKQLPSLHDEVPLEEKDIIDANDFINNAKRITNIIEEEAKILNPEKIYIGGFSQGGFLALLTGLNYPGNLGGIISLSATFPSDFFVDKKNLLKCPIFARIGTLDQIFIYEIAKKTWLEVYNYPNVNYKEEEIQHEINLQILQQLKEWFKALNI